MILLCPLNFAGSKFAVVIFRGSLSQRIFLNRKNSEFKNPRKLRRISYILGHQSQLVQDFWSCLQVLSSREWNKLITYNCIVFTVFEHTKLYPFQKLSLGFILKIFLKFLKFQPRYSLYKIYSYSKKRVYEICAAEQNVVALRLINRVEQFCY